ncbi:MAG: class I SAM-dependent methyltransferase [Bacteroidales bacterium]|nr:class I SAM-dependent methyltransferase [Bacteroidales bacterium]MBN2699557.1 class I SAM-dependent methyltransferase [Bacteroidales bacterium]
MNIFNNKEIANAYDRYYDDDRGKAVDLIEKKILQKHLRVTRDETILELGCGTGHWTEFLCGQGFRVLAVDSSRAMIDIARTKNINRAIFRQADASALPFKTSSFSTLVSVTMLEFTESPFMVLDEIDRVLRPGGLLVLGCLNIFSELGKRSREDPVFKHAHFFSPAEAGQLLSRFGTPELSSGVYFSSAFELLDGREERETVQPAFIVGSVIKNKHRGNNG